MKFGPVSSELTGLICEHQIRHGEKTGAFSRISRNILDRFSQSFHHMKLLYVQMMDLYLIFEFFKGCCHGNQIMVRKCYQCRLIPLAFVALVIENELQYRGLAVRVNSRDDGATSSKSLVNFCLISPEMTGLMGRMKIALRVHVVVRRISLNISGYTGRFLQSFHHMKAVYVPMVDLYLVFQFVKRRCNGNQVMLT